MENPVLLTISEMAKADRIAKESYISGIELMENAGSSVVREITQRWKPCKVAVLCGPGNNGGDGFVVARLLAAAGWQVKVGLLGKRGALKGEALHHIGLWNGVIEPLSPDVVKGAELVVDAVFGAGLTRAVTGAALDTLKAAEKSGVPVVAVDVPSGVMGDTGESLGAIPAALTVTFFRKKPGHLLLSGRLLCGDVVVADIGIKTDMESIKPDTFENDPALWREALPKLAPGANKYTRGHALIYGGYPMTGAAKLAARGAARAGAGLTSVTCPQKVFSVFAASLTSIMVKPLATAGDLKKLLGDKRITAVLTGPGAGVSKETKKLALSMLASGKAVVLDADAISVFRDDLATLKSAIQFPCVMTPHDGEFKRVFETSGDKLTRARKAAKASGAVIVLKGADTVIAAPDGRAAINANAPAWLATAGSGDVLGGIITGLLAQGMEPFAAASAAVWLHGEAAMLFGPGLIAEDIPEMLPEVWSKIL